MSSHENWFHFALRRDLNLYEILLVAPSATPREIRQSYERLKSLWVDRPGEPGEMVDRARQEFIEQAFHVLIDPRMRQQYDDFLFNRSRPGPMESEPESEPEMAVKRPEKGLHGWGRAKAFHWLTGLGLVFVFSSILAWASWFQGDSHDELAMLRQLYPPAPQRWVPPDGAESQDRSDLFRSSAPEPELSGTSGRPSPLLHEESSGDSSHEPQGFSPSRRFGDAGLLRDKPIHQYPGAESLSPSSPRFRVDLLHHSPGPGRRTQENMNSAWTAEGKEPAGDDEETAERLDAFLRRFVGSFERKDWKALTTCYASHAVEDGEPWTDLKSGYRERFEKAENISYGATIESWSREEKGVVVVRGEYQKIYENEDGSSDHRRGRFRWTLEESGGTLKLIEVVTETSGASKEIS